MSSSLRSSLETASRPAVTWLNRLPRLVPFLVVLVLLIAGIAIPGWGWVLLAVVTVFLGWMLYLGWPALAGPERMLRIAVLALAVAMTITQAVPRA